MLYVNIAATKAQSEFKGDCFGRLYSKRDFDCERCVVRRKCRMSKQGTEMFRNSNIKENAMAKHKKDKPEKKSKKEKKEKKQKGGKAGFREGSLMWAIYQVLTHVFKGKKFDIDALARKVKMFCKDKEVGIKFKESRVKPVLSCFVRDGYAKKVEKGVYKG
jgi:hypothetical protein